MTKNLYQAAKHCLLLKDAAKKRTYINEIISDWESGVLNRDESELSRVEVPGRPDKPELIPHAGLKQRKLGSVLGRATLTHAVAHIEFNAINLALDAVYRFRDMPDQYYSDWLKVASEEAYHFSLVQERLADIGYQYGDLPAHNGLWEMVVKTDHDVLIRMAMVPRVLEARGLDVTPAMMQRLEKAGDTEMVKTLKIILKDEIGHVAIGSYWFKYCCDLTGMNPEETFRRLLNEYMGGGLRGPLHTEARLNAGFSQQEIDDLLKMT